MPVIDDFQLEFDGLTLGDGTSFDLVAHRGFGMPPVRASTPLFSTQGGLHPGDTFLDERVVDLVFEVDGTAERDLNALIGDLASAFRPGRDEMPLTFQLPGYAGGGARVIYARPHRLDHPGTLEQSRGLATIDLQLHAIDPLIYDAVETQAVVALEAGGVGLQWPVTWPLVWGEISLGVVSCENAGNAAAGARFVIEGPVTDPRVENVTTGETFEFDIALSATEFLEVNTASGVVLLNGTANRFGTLRTGSTLFRLAPGDNELRFAAQSGAGATLSVGFRSAWFA